MIWKVDWCTNIFFSNELKSVMLFMHFTNDHFVLNLKDPCDASKNNNRKLELFLKTILSKNVSASILLFYQRCISNKFQTAINAPIHGQAKSLLVRTIEKDRSTHFIKILL